MTAPAEPIDTEPDPGRLAAAVEACAAVAGLHAGPVASYLPGRRIPGIRVTDNEIKVHVDLRYPETVASLTAQMRTALSGLLNGRRLAISVDDLVLPTTPMSSGGPS